MFLQSKQVAALKKCLEFILSPRLTRSPWPVDIKIRIVTYLQKESCIPLTFMRTEEVKPYTSRTEYILCFPMRKWLRDKWLQTAVSQGQERTEQLGQTFVPVVFAWSLQQCSTQCLSSQTGTYCNVSKIPSPGRGTCQKTNRPTNQQNKQTKPIGKGLEQRSRGFIRNTYSDCKESVVHPEFKQC